MLSIVHALHRYLIILLILGIPHYVYGFKQYSQGKAVHFMFFSSMNAVSCVQVQWQRT